MTTVEQQRQARQEAVDADDAARWAATLDRAIQNTMPARVCRGQEATFAAREAEARALASEISLSPRGAGSGEGPAPH